MRGDSSFSATPTTSDRRAEQRSTGRGIFPGPSSFTPSVAHALLSFLPRRHGNVSCLSRTCIGVREAPGDPSRRTSAGDHRHVPARLARRGRDAPLARCRADGHHARRESERSAAKSGRAASATVANDLRAALGAHGGAVRWDLGRGPVRLWVQRRPDVAADVSVTGAEWRRAIAAAADAWRDVVPGLAFALESDSARADVIVTWARDLASAPADGDLAFRTAGRTTLVPADDGRALARARAARRVRPGWRALLGRRRPRRRAA